MQTTFSRLAVVALALSALMLTGCSKDDLLSGDPTYKIIGSPTGTLTDAGSGNVTGTVTFTTAGNAGYASVSVGGSSDTVSAAGAGAISGTSASISLAGTGTATGGAHRITDIILYNGDPSSGTYSNTSWSADSTQANYWTFNTSYDGTTITLDGFGQRESGVVVGTITY